MKKINFNNGHWPYATLTKSASENGGPEAMMNGEYKRGKKMALIPCLIVIGILIAIALFGWLR